MHPVDALSAPMSSQKFTLTVEGQQREYLLYVPAKVTKPAPLVVMLHGGFGNAMIAEKAYGWDQKADAEGFVVAYPNSLDQAWSVGGGCCGIAGRTNVNDVAFITTMVKEISTRLPIDTQRIYATGMSNGGMMAYRLACDAEIFAAIGPVSATMLGDCTAPNPLSVIHIHGSADTNIPLNGDPGTGVAKIDGPPIAEINAAWRVNDSCGSPSASTQGEITTSVANCPDGRSVELIVIAGGEHHWPGSITQSAAGSDSPANALNATDVIWNFFAAHPKASD